MNVSVCKEWKFKALSDLWTGGIDRKSNRLIYTGLLGSIRWWFEVLVRGLGGKTCDPNSPMRCPDSQLKDPTMSGLRCVVCEFFGCTGWARKFRLMVLDDLNNVIQKQIRANTEFILRIVPLRPIKEEEWCLLDLTLRLIADYGAIGGNTVFKPSGEPNRQNDFHHQDFGLIQYLLGPTGWSCCRSQEALCSYVSNSQWRRNIDDAAFAWVSLENFWCVKGRYLARQNENTSTFNRVIGRPEQKNQSQEGDSWLAGRRASRNQPAESKKVFSFKHLQKNERTFGFVKPGTVDFNEIKRRLGQAWPEFQPDSEFKDGNTILKELCERARSYHGGVVP